MRQEQLNILGALISAPCSNKYLTISLRPIKQAARNGVDFVTVQESTVAPFSIKTLTISKCPDARNLKI